jgi:TolA-binding protein
MAITVTYSSKDKEKLLELKAMAKELVGAGILDPDTVIHIVLSDSATEVKRIIDQAWVVKKQENSQVSQAQSQIEQMQQQIQELTNQLSKAQAQAESNSQEDTKLKKRELDIKSEEAQTKKDNESRKISNEKDYRDKEIEVKKDIAQLEREQLYLSSQNGGGGNSAEPKNNI